MTQHRSLYASGHEPGCTDPRSLDLDDPDNRSLDTWLFRRGKGAKTISTSELRWKDSKEGSMSPMSMPEDTMRELLPIFVDGCREQHEPYRCGACHSGIAAAIAARH